MKTIMPSELKKSNVKNPSEESKLPTEVLSSIPVIQGFQREETVQTASSVEIKTNSVSPPVISRTEKGWVRQQFPSLGKTYANKDIQVKPMSISVVKMLAGAKASKSFTEMVDAMSQCINIDIRDLTVPDFYFFMYWLRINSYPKSPLTIKWETKYGNERSFVVRNATLDIVELNISDEDWAKYSDRLTIPTVRDMEILLNSEVNSSEKWEIQYSQYIKLDDDVPVGPDYMNRKIELLNEYGVEILPEIDEFSNLIHHGVREIIELRDENVDVMKSIEYLDKEVKTLTMYLSGLLKESTPESHAASLALTAHLEMKAKLLEELNEFKKLNYDEETSTWSQVYVAEKEKVNIGTTDINLLFP